jgi:hypothetical protein
LLLLQLDPCGAGALAVLPDSLSTGGAAALSLSGGGVQRFLRLCA